MAQGRFSVTAHKRSSGQSVAAAIAYRAGVAIVDARTGELHDYGWRTSRQQIVTSALVGVGADNFGDDLQAFAAAVETAETRANSRIGRDMVANLPSGLPQDEQIALLTRMGTAISERYNSPCSVSLHKADPRGDDRNDHGHIWIGTRAIGLDGTFGPKIRVLDDLKTGPEEITALRTLYEYLTNQALERAGVEDRIDITKRVDGPLPQPRLGRPATAEERRAAIADGIDVKNMSAAELVCAHEPVTHAGRDLRDYVLSEQAIERQLEQSRNKLGGLYRAEILGPPTPSIAPAPLQVRTGRETAVVHAIGRTPTIAPTPLQAGSRREGPAVHVRAIGRTPTIAPAPLQVRTGRETAVVHAIGRTPTIAPTPLQAGSRREGPAVHVRAIGRTPTIAPTPLQAAARRDGAQVRGMGPPPVAIAPTPFQAGSRREGPAVHVRAIGRTPTIAPTPLQQGRAPAAALPRAVIAEPQPVATPQPVPRSWRQFQDRIPSRQALADDLVRDEVTHRIAWAELHDKVADTEPDSELTCSVLERAHETDMQLRVTGERRANELRFEASDRDTQTVLTWIREQIQPVIDLIWGRRAAEKKAQTRKDRKDRKPGTGIPEPKATREGGYREAEGPGARPGVRGTTDSPTRPEPPKR